MNNVRVLLWNPGKVAHVARHGVTIEEVEQVCHGPFIARQAYGERLMLIGPTAENRMLTVVLEPGTDRDDVYHPVTARPASRKERRRHQEEQGAYQL